MSDKTKVRLFLALLLGPALLVILAVIAFPLFFNFVLSFSNANIYHIRDWRLIGFAQYVSVFRQQLFWSILLKTVIWTLVNIVFHVTIGVFLAVVLHQKFIRGKSIWRVALILPWALPQYITALTWRGMFNYEYGAVNLLITKYLHLPPVQWLTSPFEAFLAVMADVGDPGVPEYGDIKACRFLGLVVEPQAGDHRVGSHPFYRRHRAGRIGIRCRQSARRG